MSTDLCEIDLGECEVRRPNHWFLPLTALTCVVMVCVEPPLGVLIAVLALSLMPSERQAAIARWRTERRIWVRAGAIRVGDEPLTASELSGASIGVARDQTWLRLERRSEPPLEIALRNIEQAEKVLQLVGPPRAASFAQWFSLARAPLVQLSVAILLPIAIATPWLLPKVLVAAAYFAFSSYRSRVRLGRDGISYQRRFLSFGELERVERASGTLVLRRIDGERISLRGFSERDADALERFIVRELGAAQLEQPAAALLLAPQGRSDKSWQARLERLRAAPDYRHEQLALSDLVDVLTDPQADPGARAAALALIDEREHARLTRIACETAHPELSRVIERTAKGDVAREQRLELVTRRFAGSG